MKTRLDPAVTNSAAGAAEALPGLLRIMLLITCALMVSASHAQTKREQLGALLDIDMPQAEVEPVAKQITRLDLPAGRIYLDNEGFSLALMLDDVARSSSLPRLEAMVDLATLKVGDVVLVDVDGTAPTQTHYPFVLWIGKP